MDRADESAFVLPWPGRRWTLANIAVLLAAGAVCAPLIVRPGHVANYEHYVYWTRLVTLEGIQAAYSGTWPESYAIYPPVTLYFFKVVGHGYQALVGSPTFEVNEAIGDQRLTTGLKLVGVSFHLLTGLAIFLFVSRASGPRAGLLTSAAYSLNPAAIYEVAGWGQPDSVHGFFSTLAAGLLAFGLPGTAGAALGLALMSKPQAWALLPVLTLAALRSSGLGVLRFSLGTLGAVGVTLLPFLVNGRMGEFLTLPDRIAGALPVVTANAHNVWWLITRGQDTPWVRDSEVLVAGLTYRQIALPLVAAAAAFATWRLRPSAPGWHIPLLSSHLAFAWFMLTTQAHDTHPFFALPVLALVLPRARSLRLVFGVLSATLLVNIFLHDPLRWDFIRQTIGERGRWWASQANSVVNVALLGYWIGAIVRLTRRRAAVPRIE
jgi:hypothetical protein